MIEIYFSTKKDGVMNLTGHEIFDVDRRRNRNKFLSGHGLNPDKQFIPHLVHGSEVVMVDIPTNDDYLRIDCDAMITDKKDIVLTAVFADCPPVVLHDPVNEVAALVHCGWKSIIAGALENTINKMTSMYNCNPENIGAYIGPGICFECFEIKSDTAFKLGIVLDGDKTMNYSLAMKIKEILTVLKLDFEKIIFAGENECTMHKKNEQGEYEYFSFRRDHKTDPSENQLIAVQLI